jgi:glycerol uptake facilitator-like aquaporin
MRSGSTNHDENHTLISPDGGRSEDLDLDIEEKDELQVANLDDDDVDLVSCLLAELLGSFTIVLLGLGADYASAVVNFDVVSTDRLLYMTLAYGTAYAAVVYAFSYPAGDSRSIPNIRHLNPAITTVIFLTGRFSFVRTFLYWLSQITGAGIAVLFIQYIFPFPKGSVLTAYPVTDVVSYGNAWVMEFLISFFSIFVILMVNFSSVVWRKQPSVIEPVRENTPFTNHELNSVLVGSVILVCNMAGSSVSGGFMNPFFAIAIGILSGVYMAHAIVAPFLGAIAALLLGLIFGFKIDWGLKKMFRRS